MIDRKQAHEAEKRRNETPGNPDNTASIQPIVLESVTIGYVDEIHGTGGEAVPDYEPTRHELTFLARYWAQQIIDMESIRSLLGCVGSRDMRMIPYANLRLRRIENAIGRDIVDDIWEQEIAAERGRIEEHARVSGTTPDPTA